MKRDNRKEGIDLNATLAISQRKNMSTQHPTYPPKICSDTSIAKNSSDCFDKHASLDENVDKKILQILDDLLMILDDLFDGSEKTSQGIKE